MILRVYERLRKWFAVSDGSYAYEAEREELPSAINAPTVIKDE